MPRVRVAAKALIVEDGRLLCIALRDSDGDYYGLPGGGQHHGEPLDGALRRECLEELGVEVEVHDLLSVRDYISANHEFAAQEPNTHNLELMFRCTLPPGSAPATGSVPDTAQIGIAWLPLDGLADVVFYPAALKQQLAAVLARDGAIYLGDVN
jgi:ADP-ribose pyrophosphatase YjhB (NUDIX family)